MLGRLIAATLIVAVLAASCEQPPTVTEVPPEQYADLSQCWLRDGGEMEAFLVLAGEGGLRVPWLVSMTCIPRVDVLPGGAARLSTLGPPEFVDPKELLRTHIHPHTTPGNAVTHLPLPDANSPVYHVVIRLDPHPRGSHLYELTEVDSVKPTDTRFGELLELGPAEQAELLARARNEAR